jgi:hypothetical protein
VPETLSLAHTLIQTVAPAWRQTPDTPAQCSLCVTYAGVKQRWLIVWSPPAYQRALGNEPQRRLLTVLGERYGALYSNSESRVCGM